MSNKDVVVSVFVDGYEYFVHAKIIGGFWSGYIVYQNEYLMSLPSATHIEGVVDAARRALEARKPKSEFQVY